MINLLGQAPLTREEGFRIMRSFKNSSKIALAVIKGQSIKDVIPEGQYCFSDTDSSNLYLVDVTGSHWRFFRSDIVEEESVCEKTISGIDEMVRFMIEKKKMITGSDMCMVVDQNEKKLLEGFVSDEELPSYDRYLLDNDLRNFIIGLNESRRMNLYHLMKKTGKDFDIYEIFYRYFKKEFNGVNYDGIKMSVQKTKIKFGRREISMKDFCEIIIELGKGGELLSDAEIKDYESLMRDSKSEEAPSQTAQFSNYNEKLKSEEISAGKSTNQYFRFMWYSGVKFIKEVCENSAEFSKLYTGDEKTLFDCMMSISAQLEKERKRSFSDLSLYGKILKWFLPDEKIALNLSITLPTNSEKFEIDGKSDDRLLQVPASKKKLISAQDLMKENESMTSKKVEEKSSGTSNTKEQEKAKEKTAQVDLFSLL